VGSAASLIINLDLLIYAPMLMYVSYFMFFVVVVVGSSGTCTC
jgi:hypothetical protein